MSSTIEESAAQVWQELVESLMPKTQATYWHGGQNGHVVLLGQVTLSMKGSDDDTDVTAWEVLSVIDPRSGVGVRIENEFYWTVEEALLDWDVSISEVSTFGYDVHDLNVALPWLRRIAGCQL